MKLLKLVSLFLVLAVLGACASTPNEKEARYQETIGKNRFEEPEAVTIISDPDPAIRAEAKKNAKLYKQTETEMLQSMQLPDITYEYDSIRPPEYAYPFLDKLANIMKTRPKMKLIIEGHTDLVGDRDYNYWLGSARAIQMKSYLVSRGVNPEAIRVHSHGFDRPITLDTSREGRWANRRVQFKLTNRNWNSIY